jgi:hypothetical protein
LPPGSTNFPEAVTPAASTVQTAATTCDVAREAFLTGTPSQIAGAMQQLLADRSAPATAREYAQKYLAETDPQMKDMDKSIIQEYCTIAGMGG